jgi:DNA-binding MarR family transcriptional regulator
MTDDKMKRMAIIERPETAPMPEPAIATTLGMPPFRQDARGYLYDPSFREMVGRKGLRLDPSGTLEAECVKALIIAGKVLYKSFEDALEGLDISHQQFRALMWIDRAGGDGTQLHEIARWLGVTPRNVTGIVDALEAMGLAERVPDPSDRRAVIARTTPTGKQKVEIAKARSARRQKQVFGRLTEDEKLQLRHLALKVVEASQEFCGKERTKNG